MVARGFICKHSAGPHPLLEQQAWCDCMGAPSYVSWLLFMSPAGQFARGRVWWSLFSDVLIDRWKFGPSVQAWVLHPIILITNTQSCITP